MSQKYQTIFSDFNIDLRSHFPLGTLSEISKPKNIRYLK